LDSVSVQKRITDLYFFVCFTGKITKERARARERARERATAATATARAARKEKAAKERKGKAKEREVFMFARKTHRVLLKLIPASKSVEVLLQDTAMFHDWV
jgi:hypothetical protein